MKKRVGLLLSFVLVFGILTAAGLPAAHAASVPSDAAVFNRHSYALYDKSMTWHEAKAFCESLGGHLAAVTTQDELNFVAGLIEKGSVDAYWLGATDEKVEGQWEWITGEPWSYSNWGDLNPDNYGNNEHYLGMMRVAQKWEITSAGVAQWNDFTDTDLIVGGFICEWISDNTLVTASDWAHNGINSALQKGFVPEDLLGGYQDIITRAEFCRMAVKYLEYATGKSINTVMAEKGVVLDLNVFKDTKDPAVLAAYALGITSGTGTGYFTPDGQISREQAATMLTKVCKVLGMNVDNPPAFGFADIGDASSWAVSSINFCAANGIMSGTGNNMFQPKATYTRSRVLLRLTR